MGIVFLVFSVYNDHFENLYQTLERVFRQVSNHLEISLKIRLRLVFNQLLGVWKS